MKKKIALLMIALLCLLLPACASAYTMYVKTSNGGAVNVRLKPSTDSESVGKLNYGSAVEVLQNEGSWTVVNWQGYSQPCYIQSRYLVSEYPGSKSKTTTRAAMTRARPALPMWISSPSSWLSRTMSMFRPAMPAAMSTSVGPRAWMRLWPSVSMTAPCCG